VPTFESADGLLASGGYDIVYNEHHNRPRNYDMYVQQTRVDLLIKPWRVRHDGFASSSVTVPESTGDAEVLKIATGRLEDCLKKHAKCHNPAVKSWYLKRLLDLSAVNGQKIVVTNEERLHGRYATLSHSWGTNASICCLTAENLKYPRKEIPMKLLTRTFRDAITATRMLDIRNL
jgi:hypothetical protein